MRQHLHLRVYTNMEMLARGAMSGQIRDWPILRQEVKWALNELEFFRKYYSNELEKVFSEEI